MTTYNGEHAALCRLAKRRTNALEVGRIGRHSWRVDAVKICHAEDIGRAALSSAVESAAWDIGLTLLHLDRRGGGKAQKECGGGE